MESFVKEKLNKFFTLFNGEEGRQEDEEKTRGKKKIIGVYGNQGGAGVSSFIGLLSYTLKEKGYRVLVIDGNFLKPYHYCKYTPTKDNISLRTYIYNKDIEEIDKILVKDKKGIEYIQVTPFKLIDLLNFNEDQNNFEFMRKSMGKIINFYDIVIMDINPDLSFNYLEQSLIKESQLLIEINVDSLSGKLNKDKNKEILFNTIQDVPIFKIENKCDKENVPNSLPYKKRFNELEKMGTCYIYSDDDSKDDYVTNFNIIQENIIKLLGY